MAEYIFAVLLLAFAVGFLIGDLSGRRAARERRKQRRQILRAQQQYGLFEEVI